MHQRTRGPGATSSPFRDLVAALLGLAFAAGCAPTAPTPSPTQVPTPSQVAPTRLPTPVPTVAASGRAPAPSEPAASGLLLLRLTTCDDTCGPVPGTTILDDGRVIWQPPEGRVLQGRLSPAGLAAVRDAVAANPALAADGTYVPTLRPGAEPLPRGVASHRFDVAGPAGPVVVNAWDPDSLADQLDAWVIPEQMHILDGLAAQLADPVAWLGPDAFVEAPGAYAPDRYLVVVDLFPDVGDAGDFAADVDAIDWPFGSPIEAAGDPIGPGEDGLPPRCLIVSAEDAQAMRAAEGDAGTTRDLRAWLMTLAYDWRRADGFVQVTTIQLLPHERRACAELVVEEP